MDQESESMTWKHQLTRGKQGKYCKTWAQAKLNHKIPERQAVKKSKNRQMGLPQANGFCTAKKAPNKQVMNRMGGHTSKPYICYKWLLYEKEGNLTYSLVGMQISTTIMEVSMQISQISEKWSTIQLSQPSPRYIHKWNETITWKSDLYSCVNSSSFPDSDNIEPMEVDQLTTELRNQIHMTEHYSAIKKKRAKSCLLQQSGGN